MFASRPLFNLLQSTPRAGAAIRHRLRDLLLRFGSYMPSPTSASPRARTTVVPTELLTDAVLEAIKVRGIFVGDRLRDDRTETVAVDPSSDAMDVDGADAMAISARAREALMVVLRTRYEGRATAKDTRITLKGGGTLLVPGWVRERVADVLFEAGDEDEPSIVETVLSTILRVRQPRIRAD